MEHTPTRREYFRLVYPENCHWVVKGDPEQAVDERLATMLESMICQKMGGKKHRHLSVIKDIGSDYYYHSDRANRPRVHNPMLGGKVDYLHTGMSTDDLLRCVIYYMRKRNHPFIRECEDTAKYYLELGI